MEVDIEVEGTHKPLNQGHCASLCGGFGVAGLVGQVCGNGAVDNAKHLAHDGGLLGMAAVVTRTGWSAEIGYEIYLRDGNRGEELWERVMEAGKPHQIRPTGPCDIRRIEAGILNHGTDITLDNNPFEVGLGWQVDKEKQADYIGKEALERIRNEGVSRKLVGVEIEGDPIEFSATRWKVEVNGSAAGHITSAIYSPRMGKNIGYAMLPIEHAALGNQVTVMVEDLQPRSATVVRKPFVDPKKDIPKS